MQDTAKNGIIKTDRKLSPSNIEAINELLRKDQRVELIPTKDGVMVFRVRREEVKQ